MARNAPSHHRALSAVVLVLLSLIFPESADAGVGFNPVVTCETFTLLGGASEDVCFTSNLQTPSPIGYEDGTSGYAGPWVNRYEIVQNVAEGTDTTQTPLTDEQLAGIQIIITRDVNNTCTSVQVNEEVCYSCSTCEETDADGGALFSANCTNVTNGRGVYCEGLEPIFYPLQYGKSDGTNGTSFLDSGNVTDFPEPPPEGTVFPVRTKPPARTAAPTSATTTAPMATPTATDPAASTAVRFEVDCMMRALAGAVGLLLMVV